MFCFSFQGLQDWMDKDMDFSFIECLEQEFESLYDSLKNRDLSTHMTSFVDKTDIDDMSIISSTEALCSLNNSNSSDAAGISVNVHPTDVIDDTFSVHPPLESPVGEVPDNHSVLSSVSSKSGVLSSTVSSVDDDESSPDTQNTSINFKICDKSKAILLTKSIILSSPMNTTSTAPWLLEELNGSDALHVYDSDNFEIQNEEVSRYIEMKQNNYKPYSTNNSLCKKPFSRIKSVSVSGIKGSFVDKRKERKKKQNKEAAMRYRHKKQAEYQILLEKERIVEKYNHELKDRVQELNSEISYLKGLMKEIFKQLVICRKLLNNFHVFCQRKNIVSLLKGTGENT
ncbi:uncharacterized protein LOC143255012 isoform X2 [Tachypleus tridentatus]|uniref:uncharacterized protein LOC143255012 isoform X2 n=1 Tax=Tachypleus tridentatus TaxID=6853 RepID=UPI003FD328CF